MRRKRRYFRGVKMRLECGHVEVRGTSFFRLSEGRAACIVGSYIRKGVFCKQCKAICQPEQYLGTCRTVDGGIDG